MTIPARYGGKGAPYLDAVVLIEEMAKACSTIGRICVESNMGALGAIMNYGSEAQKELAASVVLAGDKPAICITEPGAGSAATETEGHDFEILRTVDFSRIRPALILYEHSHLGAHDQRACWRLLAAAGYRCRAGWADTLALLEAG
jgi:hypothetical protein